MALKRSGVRASFAPSICFLLARSMRALFSSDPRRSSSFPVILLLLPVTVFGLTAGSAFAQRNSPSVGAKTPTDVVLFIRPDSPTTARIGLAFRKRLPHAQVRREIKKLIAASGWTLIGDLSITDKTVQPRDAIHFPPVTGAMFAVAQAPQFLDNAPVLSPYLQAFQEWSHLEILLVASDIQPYNGVSNFHSSALDVTLDKSEGIYRYLVTIREHAKDLPPLIPDAAVAVDPAGGIYSPPVSAAGTNAPVTETARSGPSLFRPYLFILVGSLLAGTVALSLAVKRHRENLKRGRLG